MERSSWFYRNPECNLNITKVPVYFERVLEEGDANKGRSVFHSTSLYDEILGPDATFEISWEKTDRLTYHHAKRVRESINMYNSIGVAVTKKETEWILSHEMTYWYGTRKKYQQRRVYSLVYIHGVMLCEQTERVFETNAIVVEPLLPNYENLILDIMRSIQCHEV
ncbi:MAG: hypothetical protein ACTSXF_13050 [Promethearchaeota archaeon]